MNFDPFKSTLNWSYKINNLESYVSPLSYVTVETNLNQYVTVIEVGLPNNDADFDGTILRFFKKN